MGTRGVVIFGGSQKAAALLMFACLLIAATARTDYLADIWPNPIPPFDGEVLFPNWERAPTAAFQIFEYCDCVQDPTDCPLTGEGWCTESTLVSLTVMNYGTASGGSTGDIRNLYFRLICGNDVAPDDITFQMTYAGVWLAGTESFPTWTWAEPGGIPLTGDPCGLASEPGCGEPETGAYMDLFFYTDISPCPTENSTVALGPAFNDVNSGIWYEQGGIRAECTAPEFSQQAVPYTAKLADPTAKFIRYVTKKVDKDEASPADTVTYYIYYGTPGSNILDSLTVFDTIPAYMTLLENNLPLFDNINPPADPGYDPNLGPPLSLRWTETGPIDPAGGATREIMFRTTIDWGNGESFEPGSGDAGAPEGDFLFNRAQLSWNPQIAGCPAAGLSDQVTTVVKRYLFWMLGDQDILFAPKVGSPDDYMTYEIYLKNVSAKKTWWNVRIWDTVPDLIDVWASGFGFDDPFLGWTMTPTGSAPGTPGYVLSGTKTLLTWTLDLAPGMTKQINFKGQLKGTADAGDRIMNPAMMMALGAPGQPEGTGSALKPRKFVHEATVVLRTTFISYLAYSADLDWSKDIEYHAYFISFYPLNKATDFNLYKKWCCGSGTNPYCDNSCWQLPRIGGVSPRIADWAGTCSGGPVTDWEIGCSAERAPARYVPNEFAAGVWPEIPFNFMHKLVSNAPVIWELATCLTDPSADADAYVGTTSLNFLGFTAYTWLRRDVDTYSPPIEDVVHIINTSEDEPTTLFVFAWENRWRLLDNVDIYKESMWAFCPNLPAQSPWGKHYRFVSSSTRIMAHKAIVGIGERGSYNDLGTLAVCRETGNLVSAENPSTFYLFAGHLPGMEAVAMVGNVGTQHATYDIYQYTPFDLLAPNPNPVNVSPDMVGNAGSWKRVAFNHVVEGSFVPGAALPENQNPHIYGDSYDTSTFLIRYRLYKVVVKEGGPVMAYMGRCIVDMWSGGSMLHPSAPEPGTQTGLEYWLHAHETNSDPARYDVQAISVFCPQVNQVIRCESSDFYDSTYSTQDIDQCVVFMRITQPAPGERRNWRITSTAGGDVIAQYNLAQSGEKFYTAPFMRRGTYYDVIAPPVVFVNQPIWITITVMNTAGGTKTDYCGTTSFTSTDALAAVELVPMGIFSYSWDSDDDAATCCCTCTGPCDDGVRIFLNVIFNTAGTQSVVVADTSDGSITGMATLAVVAVDIKFSKEPRQAVASSGDELTFRICWSNYSSGSAQEFVITDAIPNGFSYVDNVPAAEHFCGATHGDDDFEVAFSTTGSNWGDFLPLPPGGTTGVTWLRWTIPEIGINTTGCVCFRVRVN